MRRFTNITFVILSSIYNCAHADPAGGILKCQIEAAFSLLFSTRSVSCIFYQPGSNRQERYKGSLTRFGADIGISGVISATLLVRASDDQLLQGGLSGSYRGVVVDASAIAGAGVALSLREASKNISLDLQGQYQFGGVSVGISRVGLQLESAN